jgi:hypothetical protein
MGVGAIAQAHGFNANMELTLNPMRAETRRLLSPRSLAVARQGVATNAFYGQVLENLLAQSLEANTVTNSLMLRLGGPNRPDWILRTAAGANYDFIANPNFDLFPINKRQSREHFSRPYGTQMQQIGYPGMKPGFRF